MKEITFIFPKTPDEFKNVLYPPLGLGYLSILDWEI